MSIDNKHKVQTALVAHHFGSSTDIKRAMGQDSKWKRAVQAIAVAERSQVAVFSSDDAHPFIDTEALFDDVDWDLSQLMGQVYGRKG